MGSHQTKILIILLGAIIFVPLLQVSAAVMSMDVKTAAFYEYTSGPNNGKAHYFVWATFGSYGSNASVYAYIVDKDHNPVGGNVALTEVTVGSGGLPTMSVTLDKIAPTGSEPIYAKIQMSDLPGRGGLSDSTAYVPLTKLDQDIPTLSEWAMIVFSVLLLGLMTWYVIKRRRTAQTVAV